MLLDLTSLVALQEQKMEGQPQHQGVTLLTSPEKKVHRK